jgi:hypothetical protein
MGSNLPRHSHRPLQPSAASPARGGLQAAPPAPLAGVSTPGPGVDAPSFAAPRPPFPAVSTPARPASDPADSMVNNPLIRRGTFSGFRS